MGTNTTNYSFSKPTVDGDEDTWGTQLNGNWDKTDSLLSGGQDISSLSITTSVTLKGQGDLVFKDSDSSHSVSLQAPATIASNYTLTMPTGDGSNGQVLTTDGSGGLSFTTITGFSGAFGDLTGKPTTISGYGITDALQLGVTALTALAGNTSIPATLLDLGISDGTSNQVLSTNGSGSFTFVDQSGGGGSGDSIADADGDTKIQVEEGTDDDTIRFDTAGSQRMVISNTGLVGIGVMPLKELHLHTQVGSTGDVEMLLDTGSGSPAGQDSIINSYRSNADLILKTNNAERMRIVGSSGDLLVGKTTTAIGTAGSRFISNGQIQATASGNEPFFANRLSSDGVLFDFRKDGTTVGSINSRSGVVSSFVFDPRSGGSGLSASGRGVLPANESGATVDNTIDLGDSGSRFKDLYLSGDINVTGCSIPKFYNNSYLNSSTTTANLISELTSDYGAFNNNYVILKNAWDYSGNSNLVTGHSTIGTIELAGCIVEAWGGTYKHIRITRPTTGTGGATICVYNDQGSTYSPGWREIWNSSSDGASSGLDADLLDGYHGSTTRNSANTYPIRNSSGYLDLGWINTTSGATTSTVSRIYASADAYLRYVTPATFRAQVISNQTINEIYNNGWYRTYGAKGWYNQSYGGGMYMEDSTYVRTYGSKQFYVNNHIKSAANVYAYWSDDRLKTKIGNIDNALDKVQSLSGFTYTRNAVAKSHGFGGDEVEVGVSAQQVKAVQPEAVHLAPFDEKVEDDGTIVSKSGEDFMTVDYPRLVPLLIEAIKELKGQVDDLQTQIKELQ